MQKQGKGVQVGGSANQGGGTTPLCIPIDTGLDLAMNEASVQFFLQAFQWDLILKYILKTLKKYINKVSQLANSYNHLSVTNMQPENHFNCLSFTYC